MKFEVHNRYTGSVQFVAEIDCSEGEYTSVKLGLAVKWAYKTGASLDGASLVGASLDGARLDGASLDGARLVGASLGEGNWIVQGATRSDGYAFLLTNLGKEGVRIKAGCRNFSLAEANAHWSRTRLNTRLGAETFEIVNGMFAMAVARGLVDASWNAIELAKAA